MDDIKPDSSDLTCYIHSVSPIKKSGPTNFFNCNLQTEQNVVKSVCFALEKKETLDLMATQRSPVKIANFSISNKYGTDDIVINRKTTLTPTTADFQYQAQDNVMSVASLTHVAPEQLVAIKGYLQYLGPTKNIVIQGLPVKKQEGYIVDPSGYMKIIFWGNHADAVTQQSTYFFNKVRVKVSQNQRYLNTPKQEKECNITLVEPFKEKLPTVDEVSTTDEVIATILGISNISKYRSCCSCAKRVTVKGNLAFCQNCKMSQKSSACRIQWSLRMYIENAKKPSQKLHLYVYTDTATKLLTICDLEETSSEDEITEAVLQLDTVKLCYDSQSHKLIDIEKIDI